MPTSSTEDFVNGLLGKTHLIAVDRPGDLGFDAARLGRIRGWMEGYVAGGRYPFACTVIVRRGEIG